MKRDDRPKRVTVEGKLVEVQWDQKLPVYSTGHGDAGSHHRNRIRVSHGMTKRQERGTLLHELGHHLWIKAGLREYFSLKQEEIALESFMPWLHQTLRENPDVVRFLLAEEPR